MLRPCSARRRQGVVGESITRDSARVAAARSNAMYCSSLVEAVAARIFVHRVVGARWLRIRIGRVIPGSNRFARCQATTAPIGRASSASRSYSGHARRAALRFRQMGTVLFERPWRSECR
jgi:hypothetical protein